MIIEDDEGNSINSRDLAFIPPGDGMYRLIVCIDIPADNLTEAYLKMRKFLADGNPEYALGWETSDEWYKPDGEQGDEGELQKAINTAYELDRKLAKENE